MFNKFFFSVLFCTISLISMSRAYYYNEKENIVLNKRQAIASRQCGGQNNSVAICSPSSSTIWLNDTDQEMVWNYNLPTFNQYDTLDLYLLYIPSTSGDSTYTNIKNWTSLTKSKGITVIHVDDSYYPVPIANNSPNVTWPVYVYIVGAGVDIQQDLALIATSHNVFPPPVPFTLIQSARNTTNTTAATTSSSTSSQPTNTLNSPQRALNNNSSSSKLPGWAIAVIVIAIVLVLVVLFALILAYRNYRNKKNLDARDGALSNDDEKTPVLAPIHNESSVAVQSQQASPTTGLNVAAAAALGSGAGTGNPNANSTTNASTRADLASIHSSTQQLWSPRSLSSTSYEHAQVPDLNNEAQSSSILSSTDALLIADTFRQLMRKPEWHEELELQQQQLSEEQNSKQSGEDLLEHQLKKEGTQVQSIDKSQ